MSDDCLPPSDASQSQAMLQKELDRLREDLVAKERQYRCVAEELAELKSKQREGDTQLRDMLACSPVGTVVTDLNGQFLRVNDAYCRITGYTAEELLRPGFTYRSITDPVDLERNIEQIRQLVAEEIPDLHLEKHYLRKDGTTIWVRVSARLWRNESGQPVQMVGLAEDISDRKRAEEELRRREQFLRTLLQTTGDGFCVIDINGRIVEANDAYCRMTGYSEEELKKLYIRDIDAIEKPSDTAARIERLIRSGSESFETRQRRKDGSVFYVDASVSYLDVDGGKFVCFFRDSSKRELAETALRESELRFRTIYDFNQAGIAQLSLDSRVQHANPAYCRFVGYPISELLGKHLREFTHPEVLEFNLEQQSKLVEGEIDHYDLEKSFVRKDGAIVHGIIGASLIRDAEGKPAYTIGTVVDITERIRAEQEKDKLQLQLSQAQKMESVGRLAGGVAHDLNNKLGVILGNAEMALEDLGYSSQPVRDYLVEIQEAARRSADLTRQLLAFARKQTIAPKVIDVNETLEGMLRMLQRLIGEDIHLSWVPGGDVHPVKMDPSQIDQILANLCVNSRDAISGGGEITIETANVAFDAEYCANRPGLFPGEYVMIAVSDSGAGMSPEVKKHLFEPFFSTKRLGEGTGLGLATVYGIVKQNSGFIDVYSELGKGTTFKIYLPSQGNGEPRSRSVAAAGIPEGSHETILLVEDEAAILKSTEAMLKRLGYRVLAASRTTEALRLGSAYAGKIALLVTDVIMPEMNGWELSRQLLQSNPDLKVLYMSGYTANVISHHGVLEEGVNYIQKPFSIKTIAEKVHDVLSRSDGES